MDKAIQNFRDPNTGFFLLVIATLAFVGSFCFALAKATGGAKFEPVEQLLLALAIAGGIYLVQKARRFREQ
jgi:VIT1/CCC1 family predicted Fe2+/Mn2+ transporter